MHGPRGDIINFISIIFGILIAGIALSRLAVRAVIKVFQSFKQIEKNECMLRKHVTQSEKRYNEIEAKVNNIDQKIDKIYTILIDKH